MRADKVMVYLIIFLILLVWGLLYLNRGSEKIFTAGLVILTTTLAMSCFSGIETKEGIKRSTLG